MSVKYLINCKLLCEFEKFHYILSGVSLSLSFTNTTHQDVFHRTFCDIDCKKIFLQTHKFGKSNAFCTYLALQFPFHVKIYKYRKLQSLLRLVLSVRPPTHPPVCVCVVKLVNIMSFTHTLGKTNFFTREQNGTLIFDLRVDFCANTSPLSVAFPSPYSIPTAADLY